MNRLPLNLNALNGEVPDPLNIVITWDLQISSTSTSDLQLDVSQTEGG